MLATNHNVKIKLCTFFGHFNVDSRKHLHGVLTLELYNLSTETNLLSNTSIDDLSKQLHKYKGICRYLKIDNEALYSDESNKIELLDNISQLQSLLKDIECET